MKLTIALAGNPNSGKTTMFNALTGSSQYVGNWPGVTVEKKQGTYVKDTQVGIVDLPGVYSLSPYSPEEVVTRDYILSGNPDVVVNLVDTTNLERNLYLTTQLLDLGVPMVVALNMMDLVEKSGGSIDTEELAQRLGCPVVRVSALRHRGLDEVVKAAADAVYAAAAAAAPAAAGVNLSAPVEDAIAKIACIAGSKLPRSGGRWYAIKLLEDEQGIAEKLSLSAQERQRISTLRQEIENALDDDAEAIVANQRYEAIGRLLAGCVRKGVSESLVTEKIDRVVTSRWLGIPIFVLVMFLVYFIAVSVGGGVVTDWANDGLFGDGWLYGFGDIDHGDPEGEGVWMPGLGAIVSSWLASSGCDPWVESLVVDGIIGGVGAVLGFVPQMILLFLMLSFLEACGYLSRVAFVLDRVFRHFGLSGKSFIPMLIASGCGVPAVMATKTIENEQDRRMTVMTTTMIPCGAKMPIIALVFGALMGGDSGVTWWIAPLFYFFGLAAIAISCLMLKKLRYFAGSVTPFIMELPNYHLPTLRSVLMATWERVRSYIVKAGTIIFLSTIVIWFLMNFGFEGGFGQGSFGLLDPEAEHYLDDSLMAGLGGLLAWLFAPLGFGDWGATVATITGLVAKENVVATVAVLVNLVDLGESDPGLWQGFAALLGGDASTIMAFCAFNLLCAPCFAAIGTIRRQMVSAKWTWATIGYLCGFAWAIGLMVRQFVGLALGEVSFGVWTVVALVLLAGMLFLMIRPAPKAAEKEVRK